MPDHAALTSLGPFFATSTHAHPLGPPWRSMAELVDGGPALIARIEQVRAALAGSTPGRPVEARVAASVTQLGLTARIVAPLLGLAVLGHEPPVDLADLYWQPELGGPFPLSLGEQVGTASGGHVPFLRACLEGPVAALVAATLRAVPVAPAVLWGNASSTVHAAGRLIAAARPDLTHRAAALADTALAHPLLRRAHDRPDGDFRRRSCCLIYRIAPPARPRPVCGDCVLRP